MAKKLSKRELAKLEAERDVWQEVLDGVKEIKAGGGRRTVVKPTSEVVRVRMKSGLSQAQFAAVLGVSKRTIRGSANHPAHCRQASRGVTRGCGVARLGACVQVRKAMGCRGACCGILAISRTVASRRRLTAAFGCFHAPLMLGVRRHNSATHENVRGNTRTQTRLRGELSPLLSLGRRTKGYVPKSSV